MLILVGLWRFKLDFGTIVGISFDFKEHIHDFANCVGLEEAHLLGARVPPMTP